MRGRRFPNLRRYAWLLSTPRLKKTSCRLSVNNGSVCTATRTGGALRSRFFALPLSGWKKYSYSRPGFAVKSSHTKLWTGWSNVLTTRSWVGRGITDPKTLKPYM
jgi:hypothetical protein